MGKAQIRLLHLFSFRSSPVLILSGLKRGYDDIHSCVRLAPDLLTPKMSLCPILTYIPPSQHRLPPSLSSLTDRDDGENGDQRASLGHPRQKTKISYPNTDLPIATIFHLHSFLVPPFRYFCKLTCSVLDMSNWFGITFELVH